MPLETGRSPASTLERALDDLVALSAFGDIAVHTGDEQSRDGLERLERRERQELRSRLYLPSTFDHIGSVAAIPQIDVEEHKVRRDLANHGDRFVDCGGVADQLEVG